MARGRMISRTLGTSSEKFARLRTEHPDVGLFAQALYPLLVANSDDFGRQKGDAFTVKHSVWSTAPDELATFERALDAMHAVDLVVRYAVGDATFLQVVQFDLHQQGLHKRAERSKFPDPPGMPPGIPDSPGDSGDSRKEPDIPPEPNLTEPNRKEKEIARASGNGNGHSVLADDSSDARARGFVERYSRIYAKCRSGALYRVREARDFGAFVDLVDREHSDERLDRLLELFLQVKAKDFLNSPGTPRQFLHMLPECDRLLRENGQ